MINNVVQNTQEWLVLRSKKIGASDANIIMGVSKFSTPVQLLQHKRGQGVDNDKKDNTFITDKGHRLEIKTRSIIEIETGLDFPAVVALSAKYDFLMASLDGYNEQNRIVLECKYVGAEDFKTVESGKYLDHYYPQIQQQMLVTGAQECILAVCKEDKEKELSYASVRVKFDWDYVFNKMLPKLEEFWKAMNEPGVEIALSKDDVYEQGYDKSLSEALRTYKEITLWVNKYNYQLEELKERIFSLVKHNKVHCDGAMISKSFRNGSTTFDYKKYFKDQNTEAPKEYLKTGKSSEVKSIKFQGDDDAN